MTTFTIGEEVLFEGERYVVSELRAGELYPVRLLQTTRTGARMPWVRLQDLNKIAAYTTALDDTQRA